MAVTQNTYTGDGATVLFSFTFPYLETADIKVSVGGTITTAYTLANATTVQFNSAPANGTAIRIFRLTDDSALTATFYPGSAIRSQDLNENFTQIIYKAQETSNYSLQSVNNQTINSVWTFTQSPLVPTPTQSDQAVSKAYVDTLAFSSSGIGDGNKGDITVSNQGNTWSLNQSFLSSSSAAATYQPLSGMSVYLTSSTAASTYAPLASPTFSGTVSGVNGSFSGNLIDSKGNVRSIPINSQVTAYTLLATDAGRCISITTGGVTVPSGVFAAGDAVTIFNNSTSSQTITQASGVTLRQTGTANTGNRTLAQYGVATLLCVASNTFVISGGGLS
jgi:hypothetical protein